MSLYQKNSFFNVRGSFGQSFTPFEPTYSETKLNGNSFIFLNDRSDFINTYDKIQAFKDETDIYSILARVANGETALLGSQSWNDFDATSICADFLTKQASLDKAIDFFNHLPTDIKEQFNNDFREFSADGGEKFEKILSDLSAGESLQNTSTDVETPSDSSSK